jgi:hypothetical protein
MVLLVNQLPAVAVVEQEGLDLETPATEVLVAPALSVVVAEVEVEAEVEQLVVMEAQLKMLQASTALLE